MFGTVLYLCNYDESCNMLKECKLASVSIICKQKSLTLLTLYVRYYLLEIFRVLVQKPSQQLLGAEH